ncbi:hypothetical protein [Pacificibacter marinus]|uniref:hypothetical protein n=1 Tax=Pacificibacter marinus TaxID=658057 RepID=UPI001C07108A|nr:hypothetical protein [Pacificibacter marinus]MBU2867296.1 hypothetical protein [Pacificibacter marinus]
MRKIQYLVGCLSLLFLAYGDMAMAQQILRHDEDGAQTAFYSGGDDNVRLVSTWSTELRTGILMGEPVISTRFKYEIVPGLSFVSVPVFNTGVYSKKLLSQLPVAGQLKPRLYNMEIVYRLSSPLFYRDIYLRSDIGIPAVGDGNTWSFNVPGSPDWNRVFSYTENMSEYLSEQDAKERLANPMTLVDAKIVNHDVTQFDLHEWYKKYDKSPQIYGLLAANKHLAEGIRRSTGHEFKATTQSTVTVIAGVNWIGPDADRAIDVLEREFEKLSNLPQRFIPQDNPEPYRVAVRDAHRMREFAQNEAANFKSRGIDPASLPQGYEPNFRGPYTAKWDGSRFKVFAEGSDIPVNEFREKYSVFYKGFGVISTKLVMCEGGFAVFDVLDPTGPSSDLIETDVVSQFALPCKQGGARIENVTYRDKVRNEYKGMPLLISIYDGEQERLNPAPYSGCYKFIVEENWHGTTYLSDENFELGEIVRNGFYPIGNTQGHFCSGWGLTGK